MKNTKEHYMAPEVQMIALSTESGFAATGPASTGVTGEDLTNGVTW